VEACYLKKVKVKRSCP